MGAFSDGVLEWVQVANKLAKRPGTGEENKLKKQLMDAFQKMVDSDVLDEDDHFAYTFCEVLDDREMRSMLLKVLQKDRPKP